MLRRGDCQRARTNPKPVVGARSRDDVYRGANLHPRCEPREVAGMHADTPMGGVTWYQLRFTEIAVDADYTAARPVGQRRVSRGSDRVGPVGIAAVRKPEDLANPEPACRSGRTRLADADGSGEPQPAFVVGPESSRA